MCCVSLYPLAFGFFPLNPTVFPFKHRPPAINENFILLYSSSKIHVVGVLLHISSATSLGAKPERVPCNPNPDSLRDCWVLGFVLAQTPTAHFHLSFLVSFSLFIFGHMFGLLLV
jgi:hypothetical protein